MFLSFYLHVGGAWIAETDFGGEEEVKALAKQFSAEYVEGSLAMGTIQGHLTAHRKRPRAAADATAVGQLCGPTNRAELGLGRTCSVHRSDSSAKVLHLRICMSLM